MTQNTPIKKFIFDAALLLIMQNYNSRQYEASEVSKPSYFIPIVVPFIAGLWLGGLKDSKSNIHHDSLDSIL